MFDQLYDLYVEKVNHEHFNNEEQSVSIPKVAAFCLSVGVFSPPRDDGDKDHHPPVVMLLEETEDE